LADDLARIVRCALEAESSEFIRLVKEATSLLSRENGRVGGFEVTGRLITAKPGGHAIVIGDLHGDLESLVDILKTGNCLQEISRDRDRIMVFLGDYGDRGNYSAEVYYVVLKLKLLFPEQIVLMRGNHEYFWVGKRRDESGPSPHDLPQRLKTRFGGNGEEYRCIRGLFDYFYGAVLVEGRYLMVHGGLPERVRKPEDLAFAHTLDSKDELLEDMLWSDPDETVEGTHASPRGAGKLFGKNVTDKVLSSLGVAMLIRGHQFCEEGYRINHGGKILTLFSCKSTLHSNSHGAYLTVDSSEKFSSAYDLVPCITQF